MKAPRIVYVAIVSRLITLLFSALFDSLLADYDTSSRLQILECDGSSCASGSTPLLGKFVWDSVFFIHLARCGYQYEQFYAFYPMLPAQALLPGVADDTAMRAAGHTVNIAAFALSALCFSKLSDQVLGNRGSAGLATLLYCCNPASVFYSAFYTESIYACASFLGLMTLHKQAWSSTLAWCIAAATRSNGVLYCGFILQKGGNRLLHSRNKSQVFSHAVLCMQAAAQCIAICIPTAWVQIKGWQSFCGHTVHRRPWCSSAVPNIYSFVQSHYWDVGLLRYYKMQQVPNFLLAAPMLCLSVTGCFTFCCCQWRHALSSDSDTVLDSPHSEAFCVSRNTARSNARRRQQVASTQVQAAGLGSDRAVQVDKQQGFSSSRAWPHIIHLAFLTTTAALVMNIQVATRFLSACPAVYWYAATLQGGPYFKFVWAYFLGYFMLGTILFPNFYPWT